MIKSQKEDDFFIFLLNTKTPTTYRIMYNCSPYMVFLTIS